MININQVWEGRASRHFILVENLIELDDQTIIAYRDLYVEKPCNVAVEQVDDVFIGVTTRRIRMDDLVSLYEYNPQNDVMCRRLQ